MADNPTLGDVLVGILSITKTTKSTMKEFINKHINSASNEISKECGMYLLSKNLYTQMLVASGLEEQHLKNLYLHMPFAGYILTNPFYNLCLIYIITFKALGNDIEACKTTSRFYTYVSLSYIKRKYFNICNPEVMRYTLSMLHGSSMAKEGYKILADTISDETLNKYLDTFGQVEIYYYYRYLVDVRNKLNQSVKLIAHKYYQFIKEKPSDDTDQSSAIAEKIYKYIYKNNTLRTEQVIEFISSGTDFSVDMVEKLIENMIYNFELASTTVDIISEMIDVYKNMKFIKDDNINDIYLKIYKNTNIRQYISTLLDSMEKDDSIDPNQYVKPIIYICILMIKFYR